MRNARQCSVPNVLWHPYKVCQQILGQGLRFGVLVQCPKVRWHHCKLCQQRIEKEGLIDEYGLQSWFIGRINHFLQENGKSLIGWDETLEGGLNPGTLVMSWRVSKSTHLNVLCLLHPQST